MNESTELMFTFDGERLPGDFFQIVTPNVTLTLNYPRSWFVRRIWRWFGFEWTRAE